MIEDTRILKDDFELLDAWASGDAASACELMRRYTAALVRFFERKLDGPIEDLVQDTLLACIEARDRFRRQADFRSYLFGIARNILFAHLRARNRDHAEVALEPSCLHDEGPTPSEIVVRRTEDRRLLEALRSLPVATQVLLELYHWQCLTGPALAGLYGVRERTLRSRLSRAKEALRSSLERLADTPDLVRSTWADFEGWAESLPKLVADDDAAGSAA